MSTLVHDTARRRAWTARAVNLIVGLYRSWTSRRQFMRLCDMTDAELADIGLRRADLRLALGLPFGDDPTVYLNAIVQERLETVSR